MGHMDEQWQWREDILGPDFEATRLDLPDAARATLVRHVPATPEPATAPPRDTVVLHLHGWSDYFFHRELAEFWSGRGAHFFALDFRNYGRNLIPDASWPLLGQSWDEDPEIAAYLAAQWNEYGTRELAEAAPEPSQRPGYASSIALYNQDVTAALRVIGGLHPGARLIVSAHSMGGLVATLWAADLHAGRATSYAGDAPHPAAEATPAPGAHAGTAPAGTAQPTAGAPDPDPATDPLGGLGELAGLCLNSPWLEFQYSTAVRKILMPVMRLSARRPDDRIKPLPIDMPNFYTLAAAETHGRPQYDLALKPAGSFPVYPDWLSSIFAGQERIYDGIDVGVPVLIQTSAKTYQSPRYSSKMTRADIVLNVDLIRRAGAEVGDTVVLQRIPGAVHDVFASAPEQLHRAYAGIAHFAAGYLDA